VLSTRAGLYSLTQTGFEVPANSPGSFTLSCKKPSDIVLNGGCAGAIQYPNAQILTGSYPTNADNSAPEETSGWTCTGWNYGSNPFFMSAYITCITVP
jgi:hypothetical protein